MPERLRVTHLEAAVILTNEVLGLGQYSIAVAKALHNQYWEMSIARGKEEAVRPDLPPERAALLQDTVNRLLTTLRPVNGTKLSQRLSAEQFQNIVRTRFGLADGFIHSKPEVGKLFGVTTDDVIVSLEQASRKLRHPRSMRALKEILNPQLSLPESDYYSDFLW